MSCSGTLKEGGNCTSSSRATGGVGKMLSRREMQLLLVGVWYDCIPSWLMVVGHAGVIMSKSCTIGCVGNGLSTRKVRGCDNV